MNSDDGYRGIGEFYDLFASNDDLPFYHKYAKECGSPILDIAAGTCRVSIPLAEAGFEVVALEKSPSMLDAAYQKLDSLPIDVTHRITIIQADMSDFETHIKFSLVIIPFSFGHAMTTDAQLNTLRCIRAVLSKNGIFILDLYPGAIQNEHATFSEGPEKLKDGREVTRRGEIKTDFVNQILNLDLEYEVKDSEGNMEVISVSSNAAIIYNREVDLLLRLVGFEVIDEFGGYDFSSYQDDSARRILILKKTEPCK